MEASTRQIEPEPHDWSVRPLPVAGRMWCGAIAFFFGSFLFAYFYLRSLNTNNAWKLGHVHPAGGLGAAVMAVLLVSGVLMHLGSRRPADTISTGFVAFVLALIAVALQFVQYSVLDFGPASGAYASVFFGWTATYALSALCGAYWIETQVAALWRAQRNGFRDVDEDVLRAGITACSTCWTFFVAIGVVTFIVLYLV